MEDQWSNNEKNHPPETRLKHLDLDLDFREKSAENFLQDFYRSRKTSGFGFDYSDDSFFFFQFQSFCSIGSSDSSLLVLVNL